MINTHRREIVELRGVEPLASRVRFLRSASGSKRGDVTRYGHFWGVRSSVLSLVTLRTAGRARQASSTGED